MWCFTYVWHHDTVNILLPEVQTNYGLSYREALLLLEFYKEQYPDIDIVIKVEWDEIRSPDIDMFIRQFKYITYPKLHSYDTLEQFYSDIMMKKLNRKVNPHYEYMTLQTFADNYIQMYNTLK